MKAIEFENVGKQYRLGLVSTGTISHDLNRWWTMNVLHKEDPYLKVGETNDRSHKGNSDYVWALKDINFSIEEGDVVGIIGKNGAGKSTLLKLLSRVTAPTTGQIRARGRIASLLEVGTGFHPEMTGRENIFLNGAIMGMTKAEISRKLDEIVDFSGCERYIDTPVKRYSSGMTVRLGFAIAAHLEPEILVVDEVLAVGDAEFQKKAIGKMQDVSKGEGRTVLFVSHNMGSIRALCNSGVLLENGTVKYLGTAVDTVNHYLKGRVDNLQLPLSSRTDRFGIGTIKVENIALYTTDDEMIDSVISGQSFKLRYFYESYYDKEINNVLLSFQLTGENEMNLCLVHNRLTKQAFTVKPGKGIFDILFNNFNLNAGSYMVSYTIMGDNGQLPYLDGIENAFKLNVEEGDFYRSGELAPRSFGPILLNANFYNKQ